MLPENDACTEHTPAPLEPPWRWTPIHSLPLECAQVGVDIGLNEQQQQFSMCGCACPLAQQAGWMIDNAGAKAAAAAHSL